MYVYQADTYCDSCGLAIIAELREQGHGLAGFVSDSDEWPQSALEEATDGPDHCSGEPCKEGIDLGDYGLAADAPLYGAERRVIGALLSDGLTEYGAQYLAELLADTPLHYSGPGTTHVRTLTPYQRALHTYWREVFADELTTV